MRRALLLGAAAALLSGCEFLTGDFRLSGKVYLAPAISERTPRTNVVLFLVAKNEGGVPVALRRIVNPEFPAKFEMDGRDLLVPALRRQEVLTLHAEMNARGDVGAPRPGDLVGKAPGVVRSGARGVRVLLDRYR